MKFFIDTANVDDIRETLMRLSRRLHQSLMDLSVAKLRLLQLMLRE